jgi:hypothetical protein
VINGEQVRRVEGSKFLWVWVDAERKWRGYIDQVGEDVAAPKGTRWSQGRFE